MFEFKKLVQPVAVKARNLREGKITVVNKQNFSNLAWLRGDWELTVDGKLIQKGRLPRLQAGPGESQQVSFPLEKPDILPGQECFLNIRFIAQRATSWCDAGHEVAWEQFKIPFGGGRKSPVRPDGKLTVEAEEGLIIIKGKGFSVTFNGELGRLTSLRVGRKELLAAGPLLNLWRAATDNDGIKLQAINRFAHGFAVNGLGLWQDIVALHGIDAGFAQFLHDIVFRILAVAHLVGHNQYQNVVVGFLVKVFSDPLLCKFCVGTG